jgi:hypothetical protein
MQQKHTVHGIRYIACHGTNIGGGQQTVVVGTNRCEVSSALFARISCLVPGTCSPHRLFPCRCMHCFPEDQHRCDVRYLVDIRRMW